GVVKLPRAQQLHHNLPIIVADVINKERGSSQADVPDLISQELDAHAPKIIEELFKIHMQNTVLNMKSDLWYVLKAKYEKSSASTDPCRTDAFRKRDHDDHQGDDAHPKGEKNNPVVDEDEVILGDETPEFINEFQNVDKRVSTIFDRERMEAKLRDMLSNQFRDAKEYAYHLERSHNYMENQIRNLNEPPKYLYNKDLFFLKHGNTTEKRIVEVVRVNIEQQHRLDFMEQIIVIRENNKPSNFSEADFKYLNKNDIEDMYYLCLNKKERVHDFQLGIESYQIKINFTAPTLIFPGIEECDPFSIVDKPTMSLIYLNIKNKKRRMSLVEIAKFCDATLEKENADDKTWNDFEENADDKTWNEFRED
ncbi:hypothetical protein Tco_0644770, partial [Tanacetum coccineum]